MSALNSVDEKELVLLLKAGDRKAFDRIYHAYKRRVYSSLKKLLHSDLLAEELLQEVFFKLWVKRELLDADKLFSAYLFRMAANLVYDIFVKLPLTRKCRHTLLLQGRNSMTTLMS